ncbi:hypothetical protein GUY40_25395 [Pseudomonas sp. R5(2019)]|nr:hypothetical protein [Pseudomonas sp. R5(2019)]
MVTFGEAGKTTSIQEKPSSPQSNYLITQSRAFISTNVIHID